jgi:branched-chain amino acid transport system substrate-binding protein
MIEAMWVVEAIRKAQEIHKTKQINAAMMRDGLEALDISEARNVELGLSKGFAPAVKITCANHEGTGRVMVQQWDGAKWKIVSEQFDPDRDVVGKLIAEDSEKYAKDNNITPRDCK